MTPNRLAGHALRNEGRLYEHGMSVRAGVGRCECGATSPILPGPSARRRWHREHKDAIRTDPTRRTP